MKLSKTSLRNIIKEELEALKEETQYQRFFKKALKKFGVNSPDDFESEEKQKEFFDYVDNNWKADDEPTESVNEHTDTREFKGLMNQLNRVINSAEEFGSDAKRKPDTYSDITGDMIVDKLKELYNAAIYGDRKIDRSREVFK